MPAAKRKSTTSASSSESKSNRQQRNSSQQQQQQQAGGNGRRRTKAPDGQEMLAMELREIYSAETQLARALPRLAKSAQSPSLRQCVQERITQGERLIRDIENALAEIDESPGRKRNVAAEGLINDAREHAEELAEGPARDAALIAALQKTEHYCIAAWGTAKALAKATGQQTAAQAMERAVEEGSDFDERLTELAESEVNPALLAPQAGGRGMGAGMGSPQAR